MSHISAVAQQPCSNGPNKASPCGGNTKSYCGIILLGQSCYLPCSHPGLDHAAGMSPCPTAAQSSPHCAFGGDAFVSLGLRGLGTGGLGYANGVLGGLEGIVALLRTGRLTAPSWLGSYRVSLQLCLGWSPVKVLLQGWGRQRCWDRSSSGLPSGVFSHFSSSYFKIHVSFSLPSHPATAFSTLPSSR